MASNWSDGGGSDGVADGKRHPDRHPSRHEVHASMHAADENRPVDDFTDPADRTQTNGAETEPEVDEAEKLVPEVLDELDHSGLDVVLPDDHPGGVVEEQSKGLPARWGKAGP